MEIRPLPETLIQYAEAEIARLRTPGAAIGILHDGIAYAGGVGLTAEAEAEPEARERSTGELAWTIAAYLPNRLFDLCDVFRLRVRVGSGFAVGARVTRYLPIFAGDYQALWLGMPGPRGRARLPLPAGTEGQSGIDAGIAQLGSGAVFGRMAYVR